MEGLNNLLVELQVAHVQDNFLEVLENDSDIESATSWYEDHDGDVFKFKQSVYECLSTTKELQSAELNSAAFNNHSGRSNLFSLSYKLQLIKAKTRVATLDAEAAFLKEQRALKMAEEELEHKVTVHLQGCFARKRCSECSLSGRYLNPYIKLKLIELAIKLYKEF